MTRYDDRIMCGPAGQDWYDLAVLQQGFAPIHIKNWSDVYENQPYNQL